MHPIFLFLFLSITAYNFYLTPTFTLLYSDTKQARNIPQQQLGNPLRIHSFPIVQGKFSSSMSFKSLHAGTARHNLLLPTLTTNLSFRDSLRPSTIFQKIYNELNHRNLCLNHKLQHLQTLSSATMTTRSKSKSNEGSSKKQASALRKPTQDKKGKDKTKAAGWKDTIETRAAQHNMTIKWTDDTITEQQINKEDNTSNKENTPTNMESDRDTSTTTNGSNRISLGNPTGETTTEPSDNKMEKLLRENIVYTTLIVAPPKTKASKRIKIYISMLKFIFKIIQSIDEDIILYTYDDTIKENITSDMTLFGGSTTTFPNSLTSLKKFFAGLHVRDTTKLYLNLRIGTNKDAKDVIGSGNALLQDATDPDVPESCNANWYAKHLQVPYTEDCGWIAGLFYNCNGKEFETILQSRLDTCYDKGKLKIRIPISVRAKNVRLAPNTAKKQDNNKKQNDMTTRTFHVEVPKGTKQTASSYIHSILKRSPALSARTNVKFTWVPVIDKDASTADIAYSSAALAHHKSLLSSCEFSYVPGIEDLNVTSNRLGGKSLRDIILSLTLPSDDTRKVFVLA